jgi:hypothetical protein
MPMVDSAPIELIGARHRGQPMQGGKSDEAFRCSAGLGGRRMDTGRGSGGAYRLLQFELRHSELVSLLAHHVQKLIRAFALGLDTETL